MSHINKYALIAGGFFSFLMFISYSDSMDLVTDIPEPAELPQIVRAPDINQQFDWAGEMMPQTADAKERLDRELIVNSYRHSVTLQHIKLANRYFPVIEQILREKGIPEDFKYLAIAESDLRFVTSHANARGFWQFRKLAAKERGLEVNDEVDERFHVEKSTRAACEYLLWLKQKFNTWTDAAAAYNIGPTRYKKEQERQQESNYYDMNLNQETSRYIFRLIAIKEIQSNPENYGFYLTPEEKYPPLDDYYEVVVDESIKNWGEFAHDHDITYRDLKRYNPWLLDNHLTVIKNTYKIKIPR